jgi:hypothetical protein
MSIQLKSGIMSVPTGFSNPIQLILETERTVSGCVLQLVNNNTEIIAIDTKILIMIKVLLLFKSNFFSNPFIHSLKIDLIPKNREFT